MSELDYPEQSYYPGARVVFTLRFDDPKRRRFNGRATLQGNLKAQYPKVLTITENPDGSIALKSKEETLHTSKYEQSQLAVGGDAMTTTLEGIIPLRATLNLNGIRTASTLSLTLAFADLPIEPRMIRGAEVRFYLGTTTADDFASGIEGQTAATGTNPNNKFPLNLIPLTYKDGMGRQRTNLRFVGWVDDWQVNWLDGQATVELKCRDSSSLLIDTEAPQYVGLRPDLPINKAIAEYLAIFPQFAGTTVQYLPKHTPIPSYNSASAKSSYRPIFGPPSIMGGKMSVLDYITDIVAHLGLIARFDAITSTIIVQPSRSLYGENFRYREDDPYRGRITSVGKRFLPYRMFIFGRNVAEMTIKRNFTVAAPTTIELVSYSTRTKRRLAVRYPADPKDRLERGLPGTILPDEKIQVFNYDGIENKDTLYAVAQNIYEQLGRNEIELSLKTRDLASYGGWRLDPDLLDCKAGDTIMFEVTSDTETGELNVVSAIENVLKSPESAETYLRTLGYTDDKFIKAFAIARENSLTQPFFRVRHIDFDWTIENGIDISVTAVNYIEVRGDKLPNGKEITPTQTSAEIRQKQIQDAQSFGMISVVQKAKS
jgi:hypothetical protein